MKSLKKINRVPVRNLTITTKCSQEISIHIIHEVYLQDGQGFKPMKILNTP
jgi:hypothetical protein